MTDARPRARLQRAGILILAAGLCVSGLLFWRSLRLDSSEDDEGTLREQEQSRAYELEMQKNVGPVGLLMSRWSGTLARLGEPRPLAVETLVVAGLVAGGCFRAASRLPRG